MNQPDNIPSLLGEALLGAIRQAVREEIQSLIRRDDHESDRLLTAEKAAQMLSVSPDWLYRKARKLPFSRKLGPKMLRFSHLGIEKWIATKKISLEIEEIEKEKVRSRRHHLRERPRP